MQLLFGIVMTEKQESIHDQILDLHQGRMVDSGYDQNIICEKERGVNADNK